MLRAEGHLAEAEENWEVAWEKFEELDNLQRGTSKLGIIHWTTIEWADAHLLRGGPDDITRAKELYEQARSDSESMCATGWVALIDGKLAKLPDPH